MHLRKNLKTTLIHTNLHPRTSHSRTQKYYTILLHIHQSYMYIWSTWSHNITHILIGISLTTISEIERLRANKRVSKVIRNKSLFSDVDVDVRCPVLVPFLLCQIVQRIIGELCSKQLCIRSTSLHRNGFTKIKCSFVLSFAGFPRECT